MPPASGSQGVDGWPARGSYARHDVELGGLGSTVQPLELSLALPFGALFSALLPARSFRVRQLQLEYVNAEQLGPSVTYSAQVGDGRDGALELTLVVARGARLCVRGRARLEIAPAELGAQQHSLPDKRGNSHG